LFFLPPLLGYAALALVLIGPPAAVARRRAVKTE